MAQRENDPNLHWDGQRWLRWDGSDWVEAEQADAQSSTNPPPDTAGAGEKARSLFGHIIGAEQRASKTPQTQPGGPGGQTSRERSSFLAGPAGRAQTAFDRGDLVFQLAMDVVKQQAVVVSMVGTTTTKKTTDPDEILNAICRQGWEIVSGSFVFLEQGQQSRDKFLSSGQNVAIKGTVMGYYLFRRCPANRQAG